MRKIIITVVVLVVLVALLSIDDELDPVALEWVELVNDKNSIKDNEAYFYLMGIGAPENEDPYEVGEVRVAEERERFRLFAEEGVEPEYSFYDSTSGLEIPDEELFCSIREVACFEYMIGNQHHIPSKLQQYQTLLNRYQHFMSLREYRNVSDVYLLMQFPGLHYVVRGNELFQAELIKHATSGDIDQVVSILVNDIDNLKRYLSQSDLLIEKMIFTTVINNDLFLLNQFLRNGYKVNELSLDMLTTTERGFSRVSFGEFEFALDYTKNISQYSEGVDFIEYMPAWAFLLVFKENMLINVLAKRNEVMADLSQVELNEFALHVENNQSNKDSVSLFDIDLRNIYGSYLVAMSDVEYLEFVGRVFDLNCKIKLLNLLAKYKNENGKLILEDIPEGVDISNPYYPDQGPFYDEEKGMLCYTGPFEDRRNTRCIFN